ncbi:MAG: hypothetical protein HOO95_02855 [Gallionella sp.]|nr:hypothetical protein [Gallionella sp.]
MQTLLWSNQKLGDILFPKPPIPSDPVGQTKNIRNLVLWLKTNAAVAYSPIKIKCMPDGTEYAETPLSDQFK